MIPSKEHREWRDFILGTTNPTLSNHSLKLKVKTIRKKIKSGQLSIDNAVEEIYSDCKQNYELYKNDIYQIFNP